MSDRLSEQPRYAGKHSPTLLSPESPGGSPKLQVPSPIVTRRTGTESTSARALENPVEHGKVKMFSRSKGMVLSPQMALEKIYRVFHDFRA